MAGDDDRVGREVGGRYRVHARLGEGGFATVYRAEHLVTGMQVALKILHIEALLAHGGRERFLRESQLIAALQHPNIVRILDAGFEADDTAYAVFELLEGETLSELLAREGRLPPARVAPIACDVLRALVAAHRRGVVHRDIKPENIFLARDHEGGIVTKVLDFGIAAVDVKTDLRLTRTGMLVGSPLYMSPEQARNQPVTPTSDLWGLGVVLYEALAGTAPFDGDSLLEVLQRISVTPHAPLAGVHRLWTEVLDRALAKDPAARFQTAEAMLAAVEVAAVAASAPPAPQDFDLDDLDGLGVAAPALPERFDFPGLSGLHEAPRASEAPAAPAASASPAPEDLSDVLPFPAAWPSAPAAAPAYAPPAPPPVPAHVHVQRPESEMHTALAPGVVDLTRTPVVRRPRSASVWGAFFAVVTVTAGVGVAGWRFVAPALHSSARNPAHPVETIPTETPPEEPETPATAAARARAPRPEITTPVPVGEQRHLDLPAGIDGAAAIEFAEHLTTVPFTGDAPPRTPTATRGHPRPERSRPPATPAPPGPAVFATCAREAVYVHTGGVVAPLRSERLPVLCDGRSLAMAPDLDGDHAPDLVAIDRERTGLLVISSRSLAVTRRIALAGARGVATGLVLERSDPGAVVYVSTRGGAELVAVNLRSGRVAWRADRAMVPGDPEQYGLGVGPDADGDHFPDVAVGTVSQARHCTELVSGLTGARRWTAPRCADGLGNQSVSLGPDVNEDGRGDVVVGGEGSVRVLSGSDGSELRAIHGAAAGDDTTFGLAAQFVPDLAADGFPDVALGSLRPQHPAIEVYSANDGHRVGVWQLPAGVVSLHLRIQYLEGFALPGGRSIVVATPEGGVSVLAARPPRPDAHPDDTLP